MARKRTIGFIGLGAMGARMARHVIGAGWPLVVYNRTAEATRPFAERGAAVAHTPDKVAHSSDIVFTMVSDDSAVRSVVFGDNGVLAGLGQGKVLVDMTTASPGLALELESAASKVGAATLDVRVSGSVDAAEKGELLILIGGDHRVVDRVRPILDLFGRKFIRTGGHGSAAIAKIALNVILGLQMQALSEAIVLATKTGLALAVIAEVVEASGVASPFIRGKLRLVLEGDFERRFSLRMMQKDLRLALSEAERSATVLPATTAANETAKGGLCFGVGELDVAALYLALAEASGVKPGPPQAEQAISCLRSARP